MRDQFQKWMSAVAHAPVEIFHGDGLYAGVDGCKRLARECAPAILDFGEYGEKNIGATYSGICVIAYNLCPPVDAKVWLGWIREKLDELRATGDGRPNLFLLTVSKCGKRFVIVVRTVERLKYRMQAKSPPETIKIMEADKNGCYSGSKD